MKRLKEAVPSRGPWKACERFFTSILLTCGLVAGSLVAGPGARVANAAFRPAAARPQADVDAQMTQYMSGGATIAAYLAKPKGEGKHPAVIVVHDVLGLSDQVQEVTRRFAGEGFVALAPNLVSRTAAAKTPQQIFAALGQLPLLQPVSDLKAAFAFLQKDPSVDATKISVVGFGWGGWRTYKLAEDTPSLYKIVVFYGTTPADDYSLNQIKMPVLAQYGQYDFRVTGNALWTKKQLGSNFSFDVYPGADRGFFMPDVNSPYGFPGAGPEASANDGAAKKSWTKTLAFLKG